MAHNFDDLRGIETIRQEINALKKFNIDHRTTKGAMARAVNTYHPARIEMVVTDIIPTSPSSKTIRLSPEKDLLPPFLAGQYINVAVEIGGVKTNRAYTITSSPNQRAYYEIVVRQKLGGFVSEYLLNELQVGDFLTTSGPSGQFIYNPVVHGKELVFIAGGCGITPFISMIRNFYEKNDTEMQIDLIYGCVSSNDVILGEEIEKIKGKYPSLKTHVVISEPEEGCQGLTGFITAELIEKVLDKVQNKRFFLCGPEAMYQFVVPELKKLGVDEHSIRREVQTPPEDPTKLPNWPQNVTLDTPFQIKLSDGREISARAGEPILNSLERNHIVVPAECRAGECSLCRTRLISGNVYHPSFVKLRKSDRVFNYIHPCAAYPISDLEINLQK